MTDMTAEEKKAKDIEDAMKKHDANEDFRKKMDSFMDSMSKRMDAWEAMDSKRRKDASGEIEEKGDPKELTADGQQPAQITGPDRFELAREIPQRLLSWLKSSHALTKPVRHGRSRRHIRGIRKCPKPTFVASPLRTNDTARRGKTLISTN